MFGYATPRQLVYQNLLGTISHCGKAPTKKKGFFPGYQISAFFFSQGGRGTLRRHTSEPVDAQLFQLWTDILAPVEGGDFHFVSSGLSGSRMPVRSVSLDPVGVTSVGRSVGIVSGAFNNRDEG